MTIRSVLSVRMTASAPAIPARRRRQLTGYASSTPRQSAITSAPLQSAVTAIDARCGAPYQWAMVS